MCLLRQKFVFKLLEQSYLLGVVQCVMHQLVTLGGVQGCVISCLHLSNWAMFLHVCLVRRAQSHAGSRNIHLYERILV